MKRLIMKGLRVLPCLLALLIVQSIEAATITGHVFDNASETPIRGAVITVIQDESRTTQTDLNGRFELEIGDVKEVNIRVGVPGYEDVILFGQIDGETYDFGTIYLSSSEDLIAAQVVTLAADQVEGSGSGTIDNISGLLSASRDPLAQVAAFEWGIARYRLRGLGSEFQTFMINGIPTNDLESGRALWSTWGGLNDAVRERQDVLYLDHSDYTFGGLNGSANINMRPSAMRARSRVSYALSNGNYRHRLMAFHNTGLNDKGWGFAVSGSTRLADEGYVEGTPYEALSYFAAVEKRINAQHSLYAIGFGAYQKRGRSSSSVQEAYDLRDPDRKELYNPNWGYQDGEKRNARVRNTFQPTFMLGHDWTISDRLKIYTGAYYRTGRFGNTALDWNNAADPRPDYYRYLPSWENNPEVAAEVEQQWRTDEGTRQIDWDRLTTINRNVNETVFNVNGIEGNDRTGARSRYIVEDRRFDPNSLNLMTNVQAKLNDTWSLQGGLTYQWSKTENFKEIVDLLGGEFFFDVDRFAEGDFGNPGDPAPDEIQTDLQNPNRVLGEGDVFGYNYDIISRRYRGWAQAHFDLARVEGFVSGTVGHASFWRDGKFQNGLFPDISLGESEKQEDMTYGGKAGLTYKIDGRSYLSVQGGYRQEAPLARNGFRSPRVNNFLNPYNDTWTQLGYSATFTHRAPGISARISAFTNQIEGLSRSVSFYNDFDNTFGNFLIGELDYVTQGFEGGAEFKLTPTLTARAGFAVMNNEYTDEAIASIVDDRATEIDVEEDILYLDGYQLPSVPNTSAHFGLEYRSPNWWWVRAGGNYFDHSYVDVSPLRRRTEAVEQLDPSDPLYSAILDQTKLDEQFVFHLQGGYSYRIKHGKFVRFFVSVNNILDNRDFATGGFEQLRFDTDTRDPNTFPNRLWYAYGRTFFASITLDL